MPPDFKFSVEPARRLICMSLRGYFSDADIDRFVAARAEAFRKLRAPLRDCVALVDLSSLDVQSQGMVARFSALLSAPEIRVERLAFVAGSALARMQLRRASADREARVFDDVVAAREWLLSGDA